MVRAIQNLKTKEFFPIDGSMGTGGVSKFETGNSRFEIFVRGKGWYKDRTKDFVGQYIPELQNRHCVFVNEYFEKYGKHCTTSQLSRFMAGICVEGYLYCCLSCKVSKEFHYEFAEKFKVDLFDFKDYYMSVFGRWIFDLCDFDDWLHTECGYREKLHGSMNDFLIKKFGAGFAERFKNELIRK